MCVYVWLMFFTSAPNFMFLMCPLLDVFITMLTFFYVLFVRYEVNNACSEYGNVPGADAFGKTANEACCICGGGSFSGGVTFLEFRSNEISTECLDLYAASTTNGNRIIQYGCNGTPGQQWFVDSNFYIRSALDTNKCIVGSSGSTAAGTNLIIHDCISNDSRFVFTYYDDNTFRPAADTNQCVGSSSSDIFNGWWGIELSDCAGSLNQQWLPYRPSTRRNLLGETKDESGLRGLQDDSCTDLPDGWYDKSGDNCAWYAEGTNCHDYGSQNRNFGKTANQACCACGGGSSALADFDMNMGDGDQEAPAAGVELDDIGCYDFPDFRDNVGDGCMWYAQGINCEYYGAQFRSEMGTANEACCICGGGTADPPALNDESISPGCSNSPSNWMDIDGDNCAFYAIGNNCQAFGDKYIGVASKTANMACCACGGGSTPNQQALDADIDTTNGSTNYDNASTNDTSAARAPSPLFWTISCLFFFVSVQYLLPTLM